MTRSLRIAWVLVNQFAQELLGHEEVSTTFCTTSCVGDREGVRSPRIG
jgi:hypothetical protein